MGPILMVREGPFPEPRAGQSARSRPSTAMRKTREQIEEMTVRALAKGQVITFVTHYLTDYGEMILHAVTETLLREFNRLDLLDVVYTGIKELVMNATKANLKRVIIKEQGFDSDDPEQYEECMRLFKRNIAEDKIRSYKKSFRDHNLPVTVTFYYATGKALMLKIKNNFTLLPQEEERIRDKFASAEQYTDILQFYTNHADETEGAGMGLSLVGILLHQSGIDKHQFSIYSSKRYKETIARLEIPLVTNYEPRRARFQRELEESGLPAADFRLVFQRDQADPADQAGS